MSVKKGQKIAKQKKIRTGKDTHLRAKEKEKAKEMGKPKAHAAGKVAAQNVAKVISTKAKEKAKAMSKPKAHVSSAEKLRLARGHLMARGCSEGEANGYLIEVGAGRYLSLTHYAQLTPGHAKLNVQEKIAAALDHLGSRGVGKEDAINYLLEVGAGRYLALAHYSKTVG